MVNPLTWLSRKRFPYEPLITVTISRNNLIHNLNEFRRVAPDKQLIPVLKSNAYGHGLEEIACILEHENDIPYFAVDSYFEALALRSFGIRKPILIIGFTRPETIINSKLRDTVFTVTSLSILDSLSDIERHVSIHLKIDTGMHRQGILPDEVDQAIGILTGNPHIEIVGVMSHLCDADNSDDSFTDGQIISWNKIVKKFKTAFPKIKYFHISATDGHRFTPEIEATASRLGIGLFGLIDGSDFHPRLDLIPVMEIKTIITGIKKINEGDTVGYGNSFRASHQMTVATIPFGYYEGLDRRLSNIGEVSVGKENVMCPIIGRVSMNIATIDVSHVQNVSIGTSVTVVGRDNSEKNSIISMAKLCKTITYELAVHIPEHLKRVVG